MKAHLVSYLIALFILVALDALWLTLMMPRVYQKHLSHLLAGSLMVWPAIVFYILYAFGIYFLVVRQALVQDTHLLATFLAGVVLGAVAYGTYDLTNQATLRGWPVLITLIDILWGGMLSGTIAVVSTWLTKKLFH